jgi:hypothetical protein
VVGLAAGLCVTACDVPHEYVTREFSAPMPRPDPGSPLQVEVRFPAGGIHLHAATDDLLYRALVTSCLRHTIASAVLEPPSGKGGLQLAIRLEGRAGVFAGFGGEHNQMDLALTPHLAGTLNLDLGEGESVMDLTGLRVRALRLTAGAGDTRIVFGAPNEERAEEIEVQGTIGDVSIDHAGNANAGKLSIRGGVGELDLDLGGGWSRDATVRIEASVGNLTLRLPPKETGIRLEVSSPWKESLSAPGLVRRQDAFYSDGFEGAIRKVDVKIDAGIGDLIIIEEGAG